MLQAGGKKFLPPAASGHQQPAALSAGLQPLQGNERQHLAVGYKASSTIISINSSLDITLS